MKIQNADDLAIWFAEELAKLNARSKGDDWLANEMRVLNSRKRAQELNLKYRQKSPEEIARINAKTDKANKLDAQDIGVTVNSPPRTAGNQQVSSHVAAGQGNPNPNYNLQYGNNGDGFPIGGNAPGVQPPQPYQPQGGMRDVWEGARRGFNYSVEASKRRGRTVSSVWNRAPQSQYQDLPPQAKQGFAVGRVAGDVLGHGTRHKLWEMHPADFVGTYASGWLPPEANRFAQIALPFATVTALELGSMNYNPFNLAEGGRVAGYQAINPDDEDPRKSTSPVSEFLIDRGFFGKRGRLLPWEQFREERPDISYEQYAKYQDYLRGNDSNFLSDATLGLVKGTMDGINGPELAIMGYSLTPTGVLATAATALAGREAVGRIAALRKR